MSGKKQHIVPKFLQKHFSINEKIYVYCKNKHFISNISDNFAQNYFYSDNTDTTIDDYITNCEQEYFACINKLHDLEIENKIYLLENNMVLLQTLTHLFLRTKEIQSNIIQNMVNISIENIKSISLSDIKNEIKKRMKKSKDNFNALNSVKALLDLNSIKETLIKQTEGIFRNSLLTLSENDKNNILQKFNYQVISIEKEIILSDNIICCIQKDNSIQSLPDLNTEIIYFPLASNKLLILFKKMPPTISIDEININISKTSSEKFISKNLEFINLKKNINTHSLSNLFLTDIQCDKQKLINNLIKEIKDKAKTECPDKYHLFFK